MPKPKSKTSKAKGAKKPAVMKAKSEPKPASGPILHLYYQKML